MTAYIVYFIFGACTGYVLGWLGYAAYIHLSRKEEQEAFE